MESDYLRFFDATVRLEMALWGAAEVAVIDVCGIKLGSVMALRAVASRSDEARVQDLSEDLGITIGAVSKIADRLESAGLVSRRPHATDGRSHVIARTESGVNVLEQALVAIERAVQAELSAHETSRALGTMANRLERMTRG
jgi:DNA-binding MarR family transcriptional regulator